MIEGHFKIEKICKSFVRRIRAFDAVKEVRWVEDDEGGQIWTIISAPAFQDEFRDPIYDAEWEILEKVSNPVVEFRIINLEELSDKDISKVVPSNNILMWKNRCYFERT